MSRGTSEHPVRQNTWEILTKLGNMPSVRASKHRTPFLIHSSTAKRELYINRRGQIHFRAFGMRRSYTTNFCVTQVHQDHVQIIDEKKQTAWNSFCQSADYQSTRQELRDAVQDAEVAFNQAEQTRKPIFSLQFAIADGLSVIY